MFKRLAAIALLFGVLLATAKTGARAKTYTFSITYQAVAGNTVLKPGDYYVRVTGSQVVVSTEGGKQLDITGTVETADHKFDTTSSLCTVDGNGTNRLVSVELGGSTYKVVFQ